VARVVFDEPLVVEADQGVVLVEHDVGCRCGGVVGDQGMQAFCAPLLFGPQQGRPGPVDRCSYSSGDEGMRDGAFAAGLLVLHVYVMLAGQQ
jgi:hypothetical protein